MEALALAILAFAALIAVVFPRRPGKRSKDTRSRPTFMRRKTTPYIVSSGDTPRASTPPRDAADQLRVVMAAPFQKARLMSRSEYDVFRVVEAHLHKSGPGFRLMAQTSMGEILASSDPEAFRCINSKRLDMLVIDTFGFPVLAIEHQGSGHYQSDAAARDAVKREALRKAGIEYLEIFDYHQPADIARLVGEAIARNKPPASPSQVAPTPVLRNDNAAQKAR